METTGIFAKVLMVGKPKTQAGTGRAIPLNARILSVLAIARDRRAISFIL
jgi:hypothetical protein